MGDYSAKSGGPATVEERNSVAIPEQEQVQKLRGPILSYDSKHNVFMLDERGIERIVYPRWFYGDLRIGCTTITKEAFEKLREFME